MKSSDLVSALENEIQKQKDQNETGVSIAGLLERLNRLKVDVYNAENHDYNVEIVKSVISYGQLAIKSALAINGASAIALLTFMGNNKTISHSTLATGAFVCSLKVFALGVFGATVACGATYWCQSESSKVGFDPQNANNYLKQYKRYLWIVMLGMAVSYVSFGVGVYWAGEGFLKSVQ